MVGIVVTVPFCPLLRPSLKMPAARAGPASTEVTVGPAGLLGFLRCSTSHMTKFWIATFERLVAVIL